jgi:hypothetical protein
MGGGHFSVPIDTQHILLDTIIADKTNPSHVTWVLLKPASLFNNFSSLLRSVTKILMKESVLNSGNIEETQKFWPL